MRKTSFTLLAAVLVAAALAVAACGGGGAAGGPKVIVLGFDGMDYTYTRELIAEGSLPNFARLADQGSFLPLGTSVPPLSPVAWSTFVTGMDAGGHGIFDFIHRDPATYFPKFASSDTVHTETFTVGGCQLPKNPFASGGSVNLRRGTPFWEVLERHGVSTHILRMPANYPPTGTATREITGMGTPDLTGSYGEFSFYTSKLFAFAGEDISGGDVYEVWPDDGVLEAKLHGPENSMLAEPEPATMPFKVYVDPDEPLVKFEVGETEFVLEEGEWSEWVPVEFELGCGILPSQAVPGIALFYLRSVRPELEFYVSPVNFDPTAPAQQISYPDDYAAELAEMSGLYYTQGMPEDTQALRNEVLTREEFLAQAKITGEEMIAQYGPVLEDFDGDLLFYYFGNTDLVAHMMWRTMDPEHPAYDPEDDPRFADEIRRVYGRADDVVGQTLDQLGEDDLLIVMSDHGFSSWRRVMSLNTWLVENGYMTLKGDYLDNDPGLFRNVDWSRTRAYAAGFNGLYINVEGREGDGIVDSADQDALLDEIGRKLLETIDPATGLQAVTKVYKSNEFFEDRGALDIGPDMVIGYAKGTLGSGSSALGEVPRELFSDNTEPWTGDHGMDHETVPGILFTSRPLKKPAMRLKNLAASIFAEFGVDEPFPSSADSQGETVAQR